VGDDKPKTDQPAQPVREIEVPPADLGMSEGRKGMMALPDGDPSGLNNVFNKLDALPADQAPPPPSEPPAPPPPDSE
jgi:hypothetical protein